MTAQNLLRDPNHPKPVQRLLRRAFDFLLFEALALLVCLADLRGFLLLMRERAAANAAVRLPAPRPAGALFRLFSANMATAAATAMIITTAMAYSHNGSGTGEAEAIEIIFATPVCMTAPSGLVWLVTCTTDIIPLQLSPGLFLADGM